MVDGFKCQKGNEKDFAPCAATRRLDRRLHFHDNGNMEMLSAADLLAALGHESRLAIFRLLVQAGPAGMVVSAIGEQLAMAPATLSFHLSHLTRVGLISGERESRFIRYFADYAAMDDLIAFLTSNCCQGKACLPKTMEVNSTSKRRRLVKNQT